MSVYNASIRNNFATHPAAFISDPSTRHLPQYNFVSVMTICLFDSLFLFRDSDVEITLTDSEWAAYQIDGNSIRDYNLSNNENQSFELRECNNFRITFSIVQASLEVLWAWVRARVIVWDVCTGRDPFWIFRRSFHAVLLCAEIRQYTNSDPSYSSKFLFRSVAAERTIRITLIHISFAI